MQKWEKCPRAKDTKKTDTLRLMLTLRYDQQFCGLQNIIFLRKDIMMCLGVEIMISATHFQVTGRYKQRDKAQEAKH